MDSTALDLASSAPSLLGSIGPEVTAAALAFIAPKVCVLIWERLLRPIFRRAKEISYEAGRVRVVTQIAAATTDSDSAAAPGATALISRDLRLWNSGRSELHDLAVSVVFQDGTGKFCLESVSRSGAVPVGFGKIDHEIIGGNEWKVLYPRLATGDEDQLEFRSNAAGQPTVKSDVFVRCHAGRGLKSGLAAAGVVVALLAFVAALEKLTQLGLGG